MGEMEEMLNMHRRNEDALMRIRAVVFSHEQAMAEMAQRKAFRPGMNEDEMSLYQDEFKGNGGFAGADAKKRRGVSPPYSTFRAQSDNPRKQHPLVAATAADESTHRNGAAARTAHEHCATRVGYTTPS